MIIIYIVLISLFAGFLYRLGGIGKPYKTWMRDWLIPLVGILTLIFLFKYEAKWYAHALVFGLTGGAFTTYWDDIFGYDNFYAHGAMLALASFPYCIWGPMAWWVLAIKVVVAGLAMGLWCDYFSNHIVEEGGRGTIHMLGKLFLR